LIERSAEYTIVEDLDECEANPDIDEEEPHSALILWKLSAAQQLIRSCLLEDGRRLTTGASRRSKCRALHPKWRRSCIVRGQ
jgi:hypothetical protein